MILFGLKNCPSSDREIGVDCSSYALLIVLELHNEWLDVLASALPVLNALLSVGVEVLFLLVSESLGL